MPEYEIYPLPLHRMKVNSGILTYLMNYDKVVDVTGYSWYIKGPSKNIIVNTSCPLDIMLKHRPGFEAVATFEGALARGHSPGHAGDCAAHERASRSPLKHGIREMLPVYALPGARSSRELADRLLQGLGEAFL